MLKVNYLCIIFGLICIQSSESATACYDQLGCFHSYSDIPLPWDPDRIATVYRLHVRGTNTVYNLPSVGYESHIDSWATHFDSNKQTKVITHGYIDNGSKDWIVKMTAELLKKVMHQMLSYTSKRYKERILCYNSALSPFPNNC